MFLTYKVISQRIIDTGCRPDFDRKWFDQNFTTSHNTYIPLVCQCGNSFSVSYRAFNSGQSHCKKCGKQKIREARKLNFKSVEKLISDRGYVIAFDQSWFLSNYKTVHTELPVQCVCGEKLVTTYLKLYQRKGKANCAVCIARARDEERERNRLILLQKQAEKERRKKINKKDEDFDVAVDNLDDGRVDRLKAYIASHSNLHNLEHDDVFLYQSLTKGGTEPSYLIDFLDVVFGTEYDYSYLLEHIPVRFWNDKRLLNVWETQYRETGRIRTAVPKSVSHFLRKKGAKYYLDILGYSNDVLIKPPHYWNEWKNVEMELRKIIANNDNVFPTSNQIAKETKISSNCISYHGGINAIRERMGYEKLEFRANDGHYLRSSLEVIVDNLLFLNKVPHLCDQPISIEKGDKRYRYDFYAYKHDYYIEIWGLEDAYETYRKKKAEKIAFYKAKKKKLIQINAKDFDRMDKVIDILIEKLKPILSNPVDVDDETLIIPDEKKINFKNLREELTPYMPFPDCMPSYVDLRRAERNDLVGFIVKHGGVKKVGKRIGLKPRGDYYFRRNQKPLVERELINLQAQYGYVPTLSKIKTINRWLYQAITNIGGYTKLTAEIGLITEFEHNQQIKKAM